MPIEAWVLYVLTVLAMMSTPGPSQLLILSNSASHGFKRSLATGAGDLTANFLQMLAAGLGLATLIAASANALTIIKWAGVAYLIWIGVQKIISAKPWSTQGDQPPTALRTLWLQGFITSAANPKAVVFFAALFPQFIDPSLAFWPQFIVLSLTYLIIDGAFLTGYAFGANQIAKRLSGPLTIWIDRVGGGLMVGAAILLGFKPADR
jgi:threonine/homoserine/homoserine lactone efflux protein